MPIIKKYLYNFMRCKFAFFLVANAIFLIARAVCHKFDMRFASQKKSIFAIRLRRKVLLEIGYDEN